MSSSEFPRGSKEAIDEWCAEADRVLDKHFPEPKPGEEGWIMFDDDYEIDPEPGMEETRFHLPPEVVERINASCYLDDGVEGIEGEDDEDDEAYGIPLGRTFDGQLIRWVPSLPHHRYLPPFHTAAELTPPESLRETLQRPIVALDWARLSGADTSSLLMPTLRERYVATLADEFASYVEGTPFVSFGPGSFRLSCEVVILDSGNEQINRQGSGPGEVADAGGGAS